MTAIVSIVGNSESGKTTLIEKLLGELKSRGYRVATIKHAPRGIAVDQPGTDSWRHIQAGSEATIVSTPERMVLIKPVAADSTLDEITRFFGEDYDIILAEGFKQAEAPKIEVHRRETGPLLTDIKRLFAIVTDEPLETKTRQFAPDDVKALTDLLEAGFIKSQRERLSLYVNNNLVTLSVFPGEFIANVLLAMVASLKGVGKVKSVAVFLRKD
ncbi:MAG: molybdopterin-guanine dinucleotide biosynthesis protein [Dehalococcoidales bacterium]|nr:molybdopterin-guanine dinucleotide biosynthesis protein [Dehalococcoidales bacterium]